MHRNIIVILTPHRLIPQSHMLTILHNLGLYLVHLLQSRQIQIWPPGGWRDARNGGPPREILFFTTPPFLSPPFSFFFLNLAFLAYPPQFLYTLTPKYLVCIVASTSHSPSRLTVTTLVIRLSRQLRVTDDVTAERQKERKKFPAGEGGRQEHRTFFRVEGSV